MVMELNVDSFNKEVLQDSGLVLVDFWAPWCGPCRMMAPILEDVAKQLEGQAKIAKINTDEYQDLAVQYQITGIPCLVLFKGGQEVNRFVGVQQAGALVSNIKKSI